MKKFITLACVAAMALGAGAADDVIRMNDLAVGEQYVWVATNQGLLRYEKSTGESAMFSDSKVSNLSAVTLSPDGGVAVGDAKKGGVALFDGTKFSPVKITSELGDVQTVGALAYADGLWVACQGRVLHQTAEGWMDYFQQKTLVAGNFLYTGLAYDAESATMWFGASGTVADCTFGTITGKDGMKAIAGVPNVNDIYRAADGTVYMATDKGMWYSASGTTSFLEHPVSSIPQECTAVTGSGNVFAFAAGTTLVRTENMRNFSTYRNSEVAADDVIMSIEADGDVIWVLFRTGGLYRFENGVYTATHSAVDGIEAEGVEADGAIYDLQGRRLNAPEKGTIYIQGGKKHVMR